MGCPEYWAVMAARFRGLESPEAVREYLLERLHRSSGDATRKRWISHAVFAMNQFAIVRMEVFEKTAKAAQAVDGLRIGLSAISQETKP